MAGRRLLPALALALAATAAPAQETLRVPLALAPGETSTRLTLGHWPEGGWLVQQYANLVEIRFPGARMALEVPDVPGGRIVEIGTEIREGETVLRVTLGCLCAVAIMGDGAGELTVDIVGELPAAPAPAEVASGPAPLAAPMPRPRSGGEPVDATAEAGPSEGEPSGTPAAEPDVLDPEAARERLLRELERAAAAGMVTLLDPEDPLASPPPGAGADAPASAASEEEPPASVPETMPELPEAPPAAPGETPGPDMAGPPAAASDPDPDPGLAEAPALPDTGPPAGEPLACLTDSELDFSLPDPNVAAFAGVAELRSRLLGEFDRPAPEAVSELARRYLHFGLGVEAGAVVADFGLDGPEAAALAEIAAMVENRRPVAPSPFRAEACSGHHALWAAAGLAVRGDAEGALAAEARSGRSLERLPVRLRLIVASRLGHAAADLGNWRAARRFHAMGERSAVRPDDRFEASLRHLEARLAGARGETAEARRLLAALARRSDPVGVEAQIALADLLRADPGPEASGLILDLGASALAFRGTEIGDRALVAEAKLLRSTAGMQAALELAGHAAATGLLDDEAYVELARAIAGPADGTADRDALAHAYLADPGRFGAAMAEPELRRELIRALAAAGLPRLAEALLREEADVSGSLSHAVAVAYLEVGEPARALDAGAGLGGLAEARLTMAEAALLTDDPDWALDALGPDAAGSENMAEVLARAAWRAGDWPAAAAAYAQVLKQAPGRDAAVRRALSAWRAGAGDLPGDARAVLAASAPDMLPGLEALFAVAPATAETLLEGTAEEAAMLRRLLQNG